SRDPGYPGNRSRPNPRAGPTRGARMHRSSLATALVSFSLAATASAANFSISGPGIPLIPVGPGDGGGGTWDTVLPPPASQASSSIFVPNNVTSITSVRLQGIAHTWIGDLQVILVDPNGAGHTLVCRHLFTGAGLGNAGDFVPGTNITFTDIGASW